ncbi:MAG: FHA domain-containing protein [Desulfobacterales bacterium]|nr:FHA domain-containing protein [Desulfobacterales bacterium]
MSEKICGNCGEKNPVSEEFCQVCASPLEDSVVQDSSLNDSGVHCQKCDKTFSSDTKFCDICGADLQDPDSSPDTASIPDDPAHTSSPPPDVPPDLSNTMPVTDTAPVQPSVNWMLKVVEGMHIGKKYELYKNEMLVGRMDEEEGVYPDIDLEGQDEGFVSRRHAYIRKQDNKVFVEDLGGINKTLVDNKPIEPRTEVPVSASQVIRIGKVGLMLIMEKAD